MFIKVYFHYNNLESFNNGEWINAKLQFVGQYDIEMLIDLKDIEISYQRTGFTIRKKKKWYKKLFKFIK